MNIVNSGNEYQIYGSNVETYKELPVGTYDVSFSKFQGFFLTLREPLAIKEEKIYGTHLEKVDKVLSSFKISERNFGIILSGEKGIGKTLFARLLSIKANEQKLPIINVSDYIPGIAQFLSSIQQEVVVLFDEFEKTFDEDSDDGNPQDDLLTLLDGTDNGKKLFVITCNDVGKLNDCFLNRPGRFHYHFMLSIPTTKEITEYMQDKLDEKYYNVIQDVIKLSTYTEITYDCLRAIAFEINRGYSFIETISDLNISNGSTPYYNVSLKFTNGSIAETEDSIQINMFDKRNTICWLAFDTDINIKVLFTLSKLNICEIGTYNEILPENIEILDVRMPRSNCDDRKEKENLLKEFQKQFIPSAISFTKEVYSERYKFIV